MSPAKPDLRGRHLLSCSHPRSCDQGTCSRAHSSLEPQQSRVKKQLQRGPEGWGPACFWMWHAFRVSKWWKWLSSQEMTKPQECCPLQRRNSWALSPGALSHAFGLILWMRRRVAGDMFIRVRFLCFPVFTDRIGKTICGSHCQTLWDSRWETIYWLTYVFLSFYFHYLLLHVFFLVCLFLVSCLKFFWNDAVYK